jgi:predicted extracellular nuclease
MLVSKSQYNQKLARVAAVIKDRLGAPAIVGLQEVENERVLEDLTKRPELADLGYKFRIIPGIDRRGINTAMLYRDDMVDVHKVWQEQGTTDIDDGLTQSLKPDGREAPLFARPPLVADVTVKDPETGATQDLSVVVNHLKSKLSFNGEPTEPRRVEEARFLGKLVDRLRAEDPAQPVVVLGDFNDTEASKPLKALMGSKRSPRMVNTTAEHTPKGERYSYNHEGTTQLIDHILTTPDLAKQVALAGVRHVNADLPHSYQWSSGPNGDSDHDHPYTKFAFPAPPAAAAPEQPAKK